MTHYLIENVGDVEQPVGPTDGPTSTLLPGHNIISELDKEAAKRLNSSKGLRVTRRKLSADEPDEEPEDEEKPAPLATSPVPDKPAAPPKPPAAKA